MNFPPAKPFLLASSTASTAPFWVGMPIEASAPLTGRSTPILIVWPAAAGSAEPPADDVVVEVELVQAARTAARAVAATAREIGDKRIATTPRRERVGPVYARKMGPPCAAGPIGPGALAAGRAAAGEGLDVILSRWYDSAHDGGANPAASNHYAVVNGRRVRVTIDASNVLWTVANRREDSMIVEIAERGSAYIRYRTGERVEGPTIEVGAEGSEVLADVNSADEVIGIEIVDVTISDNIARAGTFARDRGLPFPRDLVAAARGATVA